MTVECLNTLVYARQLCFVGEEESIVKALGCCHVRHTCKFLVSMMNFAYIHKQ